MFENKDDMSQDKSSKPLILALPKGRLQSEIVPLLEKTGLIPEDDFFDKDSRKLQFKTNLENVEIIRVRSFDVATFVAFGVAGLGIVGSDVLMEFNYTEIYTPLDLKIGHCHLSVAERKDLWKKDDPESWSHVRVATKYPEITQRHFAQRGVQAECIKLNGAMELAPTLGLCERIVDLVSTGKTLKENGLVEVEKIADVSTRLLVNRSSLKTKYKELNGWIEKFKDVVEED